MTYWIYVLQSEKNKTRYIGNTENLEVRLKEHNHGRSRYTSAHSPWKIIYKESVESRAQAIPREKFLKSGTGRKILDTLIN